MPNLFSGQSPMWHWVSNIKLRIVQAELNVTINRLVRFAQTFFNEKSIMERMQRKRFIKPG